MILASPAPRVVYLPHAEEDRTMSNSYDIEVAGGGAGVYGAAVGYAWSGARVLLVEQYPFLGGAATISSVLTYCGFFDQRGERVVAGVGERMLRQLRDLGAYEEKVMGWT